MMTAVHSLHRYAPAAIHWGGTNEIVGVCGGVLLGSKCVITMDAWLAVGAAQDRLH